MKINGDLYLFASINILTGLIASGIGIIKLQGSLSDPIGYFALLAGSCLVSFGWFVVSAAIYRSHGANPWWSSRRLFRLSQYETKLV